ncbi:MAG: hypothetical protein DRO10_02920 [Thermoprotei archaeon]|nr:MAG: hypothetical protein DRO10_02920 [Thermoprotei archaeon]
MSEERSKFRMTMPKKEEDYQKIEEEIHGEEEEHVHHTHELTGFETNEDMQVLLLNAIAHTLGHIEASMSNLQVTTKELSDEVRSLKEMLGNVVRAILLGEVKNPNARKRLLAEILEGLTEE